MTILLPRWLALLLVIIAVSSSVVSAAPTDDAEQCEETGFIEHLPSEDMVGVEKDLLQLCATISGATYGGASESDFKDILLSKPEIKQAFPNLVVRFYQNGVTVGRNGMLGAFSMNAPTLAAVTVGDVLILGWRGSVTIKDFIADASIDSVGPFNGLKGLEVQEAYFSLIKKQYLKYHYKDIINFVKGTYSMVPNKNVKDGIKIKRIILTGHSLGGGIAQVAHFCLTSPIRFLWKDMVAQIKSNNVVVKTIAISSPMTTVFKNQEEDDGSNPGSYGLPTATQDFLKNNVFGNMCNILYKADVVPRGYSNVNFIKDFVNAFGDELSKETTGIAAMLAQGFVKFANRAVTDGDGSVLKQASKYHHVGKLLYYSAADAKPQEYIDVVGLDTTSAKNFRTLQYQGPNEGVAEYGLENHMFLVTGPGLCFASSATSTK